MSTEFYLKEKKTKDNEPRRIAHRFYGGTQNGKTVRFGFDAQLLNYLKDVQLISENDEPLTVGELFKSAQTVEFRNGLDYRRIILDSSQ
tara:strand:- start:4162 stop:4428 length:267 start_codon:yes stop_codon:yes gene_type:complete